MAFTRNDLYVDVCDFLKEAHTLPTAQTPLTRKIANKEKGCAEFLLSRHGWNFASVCARGVLDDEVDMTSTDDPDPALGGFRYAYRVGPLLRVNWISRTGRERDRLTTGWEQRGSRILCNENPLFIDGVQEAFALEAKYGYWPRVFGKAVASQIADELSGGVVDSRGHQADVSTRTQALIDEAQTWDAQQSPAPSKQRGSWARSRWGRGSGDRL